MNKPWKMIVVLLGIFAAGGVTGGFLTVRFFRDKFTSRPVPEQWAPKHMKRLADRLDLTPEQQEQIKPIVGRRMEQLNRLRNYSVTETRSVFDGMELEISDLLNPDQRGRFLQMNREWQEKQEREAREKAEKAKADKEKAEKAKLDGTGPKTEGVPPPPPAK